MLKRILMLMLFVASILSTTAGLAQTVTDEDVEESERLKTIAQNNKEIAEALKAELDAKYPKPDSASLVGGTEVNGEFIESKMLGYCAMKSAARDIGDTIRLKTLAPSRFVVYSELDVKMLTRYQLMLQRVKILRRGYERLVGTTRAVGPSRSFGAGLIANKILDYLSLLKTDVQLTGSTFDIAEREIVAEVFNNLDGRELYYPQRIPLGFRPGQGIDNSELFNDIVATSEAYEAARDAAYAGPVRDNLDALYLATMKELGLGEKETPSPAGQAAQRPPSCPGTSCSQTTNVNVNVGSKEDEEGGGGSSDRTFFSYLQAENLYRTMNNGSSYWLDVAVVKAGGNMRVKSNFITNFMIGSRVNFSGGAIVYYHVFDHQGVSKVSGVIPVYEKYRKSSRINATCSDQLRPNAKIEQ